MSISVHCAYDSLESPSKLVRNPRNPNTHPDNQIKLLTKIIAFQGWRNPIVVSNRSGFITKGHARLDAAEILECEAVPVDYQDYENEAEEWADMLADNRIAELAEVDRPMLKDLLTDIDTGDFDMELTGYTGDIIEDLMTQFHIPQEGLTDDDAIPEKVESVCKTGDLWQLGSHRLLCGDATKKEDVERLMGGEKAILMATDPPYGDSWVQKAKDMHSHGYVHSRAERHGSIVSDDKSESELKTLLDLFLSCAKFAGDAPFPVYVWHRAKRRLFEQALIDAGYLVHQPVIWVKPSFVIGRLHYHPRCEWALHGWLKGGGKCPFYGERNQSDVWEINRENDGLHPTQKPVALFEIPLRNHTKENEICYDPFGGSGTTLIACEKLNRRCYMMEIDEHYCDVIIKRWEDFTGKKGQLLNGKH